MSTDHPASRPVDAKEHPLDWIPRAGAVADVLREMDLRVARSRRRRRLQIAGSAVALAIAIGFASRAYFPNRSTESIAAAPATVSSAVVSRPERQVLPDGSVVDLKPGARIAVAYSETLRRVVLEQGEAHFAVAKNPHRPFIVAAGEVEFRAVGTAFSVQRDPATVELLVTEGRVAVDQPADATAPSPTSTSTTATTSIPPTSQTLTVVNAGNRVVLPTRTGAPASAPQVVPIAATQISQRLAWRVPTVELSGTPLADVLSLFNQHGNARIVIADADLAKVRLSGILRADNVDTLLGLLEDTHGIRVERRSGGEIVLRNRR